MTEKDGLFKRLRQRWSKFADGQMKGAQEALLQDVFQDLYKNRRKIYKINFIRGIFFGFGSVLGGTVVIAILIWVLSWFVDFPLIGQYFKELLQAIQQNP
ncbi:MAG TPA: DUF5665 domain-containing protein [Candidatus Saccharimonadales bacterium]|jgi:hypothetical protein|nr:DUF5665 domain-containing protein [Candidatus Saccharimonadales bacterium]